MISRNVIVPLPIADELRPFDAGASALKLFRSATGYLSQVWVWIQERKTAHTNSRRLRVIETISLGEKRFVAVIQVDEQQFLVGGGPAAVAMLAQLNASETFSDAIEKIAVARKKKRQAQRDPAKADEQTGASG